MQYFDKTIDFRKSAIFLFASILLFTTELRKYIVLFAPFFVLIFIKIMNFNFDRKVIWLVVAALLSVLFGAVYNNQIFSNNFGASFSGSVRY